MLSTEFATKHYKREAQEAKVIERISGYYEAQEVPFGVVYRWYPGYLLLECGCGKMLTLTCTMAICSECGADHMAVVREELAGQCSQEEVLHPWLYAGARTTLLKRNLA